MFISGAISYFYHIYEDREGPKRRMETGVVSHDGSARNPRPNCSQKRRSHQEPKIDAVSFSPKVQTEDKEYQLKRKKPPCIAGPDIQEFFTGILINCNAAISAITGEKSKIALTTYVHLDV